MLKCDVCKGEVLETYLHKIIGTYVYIKGKQKVICNICQKKYSQEELLKHLLK